MLLFCFHDQMEFYFLKKRKKNPKSIKDGANFMIKELKSRNLFHFKILIGDASGVLTLNPKENNG